MLNPGCILPVVLMWRRGQERGWPGWQGAQRGQWAGQVVVVEHQRPLVLGAQLLLLQLSLLSLWEALGSVHTREGRQTGSGSSHRSVLLPKLLSPDGPVHPQQRERRQETFAPSCRQEHRVRVERLA